MSEWNYKSLDELIRIGQIELGRGNIISKLDIDACPGPYPIYSSSAQGDGKFGEYGKFMFDEELISWSIDGGGNFFYRKQHKFSVTNVSGYLRIRTKEFNYRFVYYALALQQRNIAFDYTTKAHPSVIRKLYSIPSILEPHQRRISDILSTLDDTIEQTEALIVKMQQVKVGLMFDMFTRGVTPEGHLRPTYEQAPILYKNSPIGFIPKEWEVDSFGKRIEVIDPNPSHRYPESAQTGIPICSTENFSGEDEYDFAKSKLMPESVFTQQSFRCGFSSLDVVFARKGRIGLARRYGSEKKVFSHTVVIFKPTSDSVDKRWLLWLSRSHWFLNGIDWKMNSNLGVPTLGIAFIQAVTVPFPSPEEQVMVNEKLDQIACLIAAEKTKVSKLRQQRYGLMHELLTGRVRVQP